MARGSDDEKPGIEAAAKTKKSPLPSKLPFGRLPEAHLPLISDSVVTRDNDYLLALATSYCDVKLTLAYTHQYCLLLKR